MWQWENRHKAPAIKQINSPLRSCAMCHPYLSVTPVSCDQGPSLCRVNSLPGAFTWSPTLTVALLTLQIPAPPPSAAVLFCRRSWGMESPKRGLVLLGSLQVGVYLSSTWTRYSGVRRHLITWKAVFSIKQSLTGDRDISNPNTRKRGCPRRHTALTLAGCAALGETSTPAQPPLPHL